MSGPALLIVVLQIIRRYTAYPVKQSIIDMLALIMAVALPAVVVALGLAVAPLAIPVLGPEDYLEHIQKTKEALNIPVIASLNGTSVGGWTEYARQIQQAGADALELNIYHVSAEVTETGEMVEQRYIDVLKAVKKKITIPVVVKLSPHFSSVANMVHRLEQAGADGVSLFNRFYQPGIDLDTLEVTRELTLSSSADALLSMRWIAILYNQVRLTLAATGGIHTSDDAMRLLLAGADVTHLCAALLQNGPGYVAGILSGMERWMELYEYESVEQLKGSVCRDHASDPSAYERANYIEMLKQY